jgi:hypothetical protein
MTYYLDYAGLVQTLKDESCQTCKYRTGTRCNQLEEYTDDEDWCSAYKQKKETK